MVEETLIITEEPSGPARVKDAGMWEPEESKNEESNMGEETSDEENQKRSGGESNYS
jgi:hypothetical protein